MWSQVYNPFNSPVLSTIAAAVPVVTLLILIASGKVQAHWAALIALAVALGIAVFAFTMPAGLAIRAALFGALTGFFPIGWIILNVIFLYQLTVQRGLVSMLDQLIGGCVGVSTSCGLGRRTPEAAARALDRIRELSALP